MALKYILFLIVLFLYCPEVGATYDQLSGQAIVFDGDTIFIQNKTIRLRGIDAPEINQFCEREYSQAKILKLS